MTTHAKVVYKLSPHDYRNNDNELSIIFEHEKICFVVYRSIYLSRKQVKSISLKSQGIHEEKDLYLTTEIFRMDLHRHEMSYESLQKHFSDTFKSRVKELDFDLYHHSCSSLSQLSENFAKDYFHKLFIGPWHQLELVEFPENEWVQKYLPNIWNRWKVEIEARKQSIVEEVMSI